MKRTFGILLSSLLGLTGLRADLDPVAWHSTALGTASANGNEWYSFPDAAGNPRVLVKSSASGGPRKLLTGGPPSWVESTFVNTAVTGTGVFVPNGSGGGYLVAAQGAAPNQTLKVAIFTPTGTSTAEVISSTVGIYTGISAELDAAGILHVGFVLNGTTIGYGRRTGGNPWALTSVPNNGTVHDTAVVPVPSTEVINNVTSNYETFLYFTATASSVRTLWRYRPTVINNQLLIQWGNNPRANIENYVGLYLRGSRVGTVGRVYFFGSGNSSSWKFKRHQSGIGTTDLETAGNVIPAGIHVALGPDGKQRVAWYNESTKAIHYLKPNSVDVPVLAGKPIVLTGTTAAPDLQGLHFGPDGMPYLLYRRDLKTGFIAFPNDNFDFNGNGRLDIVDNAFNSKTAGLEALPVKEAIAGVMNSSNRFKFRFPTVGSATSTAGSAVVSLQSSYRNFRYSFELSPDAQTWTPMTTSGGIVFTPTQESGTSPQQLRTMVGVVATPAPGTLPKRFARMVVSRAAYGY